MENLAVVINKTKHKFYSFIKNKKMADDYGIKEKSTFNFTNFLSNKIELLFLENIDYLKPLTNTQLNKISKGNFKNLFK